VTFRESVIEITAVPCPSPAPQKSGER
jgi:hypothetical protein